MEMVEEIRGRILLVEDDIPSQRLVRIILEREYQVTAVHDGAEAVTACDREDFDLILLDLMMPKMDGFEAARRIRDLERQEGKPPVPILALTAMVTKETERKCYEYQMNEFISKPVEVEQLCAIVHKYLH